MILGKFAFYFSHGFGFDPSFWQGLKSSLSTLNQASDAPALSNDRRINIGIGHSLGFAKLLATEQQFTNPSASKQQFDLLIGLAAFINFLGYDQTLRQRRSLELRALTTSFYRNPQATMQKFYSNCNHEEQSNHEEQNCSPSSQQYNHTAQTYRDLALLKQIFQLPDPEVPTLILAGEYDKIVPLELITDNFINNNIYKKLTIKTIPEVGHDLGLINHKPAMLAKIINDFINAYSNAN